MRYKGGEVILKYLDTGGLDNCVNQQWLSNLDSRQTHARLIADQSALGRKHHASHPGNL